MKVLFAVSNEEISESIVKRYQREYKEIISYKNVYYFNAILKELQKDKNYDRIVISEDLEAFTNTQYSQIDKFIFDKLDVISDEASNLKGDDIPIILICSDRREKSEEMLVKVFGIGIYNALLGNDRSVNNVCQLLNKPRLKKEAKAYYKIDSEDVLYQSENENDVSEIEIQNILAHYKRLGKDEKRYVDSFDNIASQYNDAQLRVISKFLPLNVRAILEEKSPKYQQIIAYNSKVSNTLRSTKEKKQKKETTSEKLLNTGKKENILSKPVVIPSSVNTNSNIKMAKVKNEEKSIETTQKIRTDVKKVGPMFENVSQEEQPIEEQPKRGRGRPRKNPIPEQETQVVPTAKKGRGRPKKVSVLEEKNEENAVLPQFTDINTEESTILPGFTDMQQKENTNLVKFEELKDEEDVILPGFEQKIEEDVNTNSDSFSYQKENNSNQIYEDVDISNLLTSNRKVACFIGTSKNGTSFIVNNIAQITSQMGINTAILDTTKNRNSYYIYTKNEEELRANAMRSINNLLNGVANGIQVNKNLTVYTSLPDETDGIENAGIILQTLLQKHSIVLIDCDYDTPIQYFEKTQELYLVQSFDILTIQPLTAFLRDLKSKNILKEDKLRIILNKAVKLRGINEKTIIGGMAYYNDPAMSFMTELFDKNTIRYIVVPFNEEVYTRYLENIVNCEITIKGYPKNIVQILQELSNMVYPLNSGSSTYTPPRVETNGFSPNMNSTLNQMRNNY